MPVRIAWSLLARARLREIRAYVAMDNPDAADRLAIRIVAAVEALRLHPYLGRAGAEEGLRELVIGGTPYIILYEVTTGRIKIKDIWHSSQQRS